MNLYIVTIQNILDDSESYFNSDSVLLYGNILQYNLLDYIDVILLLV